MIARRIALPENFANNSPAPNESKMMKTISQSLVYFRINYYRGYDFAGFPVGRPIESHDFCCAFGIVANDDVPGISLNKAAQFARNLGYQGRFGIEILIR